jgi:hypothetical protein
MPLRALDFESSASANSATPAGLETVTCEFHVVALWQGDHLTPKPLRRIVEFLFTSNIVAIEGYTCLPASDRPHDHR